MAANRRHDVVADEMFMAVLDEFHSGKLRRQTIAGVAC
jgi:hypothetical protein